MEYKEVLDLMKAVRKGRAMSTEKLAQRVGASRMSIENIEKDKQSPRLHLFMDICGALDLEIDIKRKGSNSL